VNDHEAASVNGETSKKISDDPFQSPGTSFITTIETFGNFLTTVDIPPIYLALILTIDFSVPTREVRMSLF